MKNSIWGTGIYSNNAADFVKDYYISCLKKGLGDEESYNKSLQELLEENDNEIIYNGIIALAHTMWKYGRLNDDIKDRLSKALEYEDQRIWKGKKDKINREKKIGKMLQEMNDERPVKKVAIYKPFITDWKEGDIFYFKLDNNSKYVDEQFKGFYVIMLIVTIFKEDWDVRYIVSDVSQVRFYMINHMPQNVNELYNSVPVCFLTPEVDPLGIHHPALFSANLFERSKQKRPKDLTYLGNFNDVNNENNNSNCDESLTMRMYQDHASVLFWNGLLERDLIWGFNNTISFLKDQKKI